MNRSISSRTMSLLCVVLFGLVLGVSCQHTPETKPQGALLGATADAAGVEDDTESGEVPFLILTDQRCESCDPTKFLEQFKQVVPGLKPRVLDWSDPEAKAIYQCLHLRTLPALLFKSSFAEHDLFPKMAVYLDAHPGYYQLRVEADFDPMAEICDNGKDDTANGKTDCEDPDCTGKLVCREEIPNHLQLFLMSHCPYGVVAQRSLIPLVANFGEGLGLDLHYIVSEDSTGGLVALHGPDELVENERQLCAMKLYAANRDYMKYIRCRIEQDEDEDWRVCATSQGLDAELIDSCVNKDGERLQRKDLELSRQLDIRASPTWLVNNRYEAHGLSPEDIRQAVCKHNPDLAGCENELSSEAPLTGGQCR